jgi:hypothetical protein
MLQVNNNDKVNKGYLFFYKLIGSPDHSTFRTTGIFLRKKLLADIQLQASNPPMITDLMLRHYCKN